MLRLLSMSTRGKYFYRNKKNFSFFCDFLFNFAKYLDNNQETTEIYVQNKNLRRTQNSRCRK